MVCHCTSCHYSFEDATIPSRCPDCGKAAVRQATKEELSDYVRIREELKTFGRNKFFKMS